MSKESISSYVADPRKRRRRKLRTAFAVVACLIVVACAAATGLCAYWLQDLPDYSSASDFNTVQPTEVYASDRTTLIARFQFEYRIPLDSLDEIVDYVVEGTVATEDERFYEHNGVDPVGIARALVNNFTGGTLEGASTITQQLVRNTVLADEMSDITLKRKVREAYLAIRLEGLYSKEEILLLYLNTINYGSGAYGIEAAAQRYFSKSADELTLAEAALLVGIPQSPSYNNPIDYPEHALERRAVVLERMVSYGAITQEQADAANAEPLELDVSEIEDDGILLYPYFSSYVRDQLTSSYELSTEYVFQGGLTVYTTLDVAIQDAAEAAVGRKEEGISEDLEVALTAIDPDTGYILAMVGGRDYEESEWNLATQAQRPAGSSFKTFTLVAALEDGISPSTLVNCNSSITIDDWEVANINYRNYGTRSIARAFAVSSNTGFARLITAVGADKVADVAYRMGITSELPEVPALTLGVGGVTTLEMADAYATLANGGTHYDATAIVEVVNRNGDTIIDNADPTGERAVSAEVAHAAVEVMEGVVSSYEGTGTAAALSSGQAVAGKTGTSENYMDVWFCGITPQISVAIWVGDPANEQSVPMGLSVADVFSDFVGEVLEGEPIEEFPEADDPEYTRTFQNYDLDIEGLSWSRQGSSSAGSGSGGDSSADGSSESSEDDAEPSTDSSGSEGDDEATVDPEGSTGTDGSDGSGGGDSGGTSDSGGGTTAPSDSGGADSGGDAAESG